jgi:hypothetical protein
MELVILVVELLRLENLSSMRCFSSSLKLALKSSTEVVWKMRNSLWVKSSGTLFIWVRRPMAPRIWLLEILSWDVSDREVFDPQQKGSTCIFGVTD